MTDDLRELFLRHSTLVAGAEFCEKFDLDAIATEIKGREAAAVEAAREECAQWLESRDRPALMNPDTLKHLAYNLRALNVIGALDRALNQARLEELIELRSRTPNRGFGVHLGMGSYIEQRIAELEARPGQR